MEGYGSQNFEREIFSTYAESEWSADKKKKKKKIKRFPNLY